LNKKQIKNTYSLLLSNEYDPRKRGFEFEKLINSILSNEKLEPKSSYRPEGEQVDGSFFWQGQTFLIEAKWINSPVAASSIYAFKGKLDGKFHTCSGVFLAVNGYSEDAETALKTGKSLNILLFDEHDIPLLFNGDVSFLDMLKFKLRMAGDTGELKVSYNLKEKAEELSKNSEELLEYISIVEKLKSSPSLNESLKIDDILVFVEGKSDIVIAKNLIDPIKNQFSLSYRIQTLNGVQKIRELPSLLSAYSNYAKPKAAIVILDDDIETKGMESEIDNIIEQINKSSISIKLIFLTINSSLYKKLSKLKIDYKDLRNEQVFEKLENFIEKIAEEYYDPTESIPQEALEFSFDKLEWDFKNKVIITYDDYSDHAILIDSLEKLIQFLNEEMIQAMYGEMSMEWLKDQDYLNYETEVREYLHDNFLREIKKMKWDINSL
jgi:hypothetical protein